MKPHELVEHIYYFYSASNRLPRPFIKVMRMRILTLAVRFSVRGSVPAFTVFQLSKLAVLGQIEYERWTWMKPACSFASRTRHCHACTEKKVWKVWDGVNQQTKGKCLLLLCQPVLHAGLLKFTFWLWGMCPHVPVTLVSGQLTSAVGCIRVCLSVCGCLVSWPHVSVTLVSGRSTSALGYMPVCVVSSCISYAGLWPVDFSRGVYAWLFSVLVCQSLACRLRQCVICMCVCV